MRDEAVAAREIDDAPAPESAPRPSRDFPGLVELLAWEAVGLADHAADAIEERVAREMMR